MRLTDAYDRSLAKRARRHTRRLLRGARPGETITLVIWGKRAQDAYLAQGWHPQSESPRVDLTDPYRREWTEMTMTLIRKED